MTDVAGAYDDPTLTHKEIDARLKAKREERQRLNTPTPADEKPARKRRKKPADG